MEIIIRVIVGKKKKKINDIHYIIDSLVKQGKVRDALDLIESELENLTGRPQSEIGGEVAKLKGIKMALEIRLGESQ